jgi:hypothetical protein
VSARLEDTDRALLAVALLAEETEAQEIDSEFGRRCLDSMRRSEQQQRRAELKAQVKQAERAGNLNEALRLSKELILLERQGAAEI